MPLLRTYKEDEFLLGIWKVEESAEQLLGMLRKPSQYETDLQQFSSDSRKHEWLSVRVLLQELAGAGKKIAYRPSGKPYLKDGGCISISHTRGYVAVALHPFYELGIDIEQYADRVKKVASRFIRPDEEPNLLPPNEIYALLIHWSAKETLFKLIDEENVDFIHHLRIMPFVLAEEGTFKACEYRTSQQRQFTLRYLTHPDFVLTWVMDKNNAQTNHFG